MDEENILDDQKIIIQKNGQEVECDILFTFDCEDTGKAYIGYTDNSISGNGRKNIYVSAYDPVMGYGTLEDIETEEEKAMINDVLMEIDRQS